MFLRSLSSLSHQSQMITLLPSRTKRFELRQQFPGAFGILRDSKCLAPREFQQFVVAQRLSERKGCVAVLPRAKKFPWAALFQVALRDFKAVRGGHHGFQALAGFPRDRP